MSTAATPSTMQTHPSVEENGAPAVTSVVLFTLVTVLIAFVLLP